MSLNELGYAQNDKKMTVGITCSFTDIKNYIHLPIKCIQILFETRKNRPINVPLTEIKRMGIILKQKGITPYIHFDLNIMIFSSYRIMTQNRIEWLFKYANELQAQGCIIHCGSMWTKKKRPKETDIQPRKEVFKARLQKILDKPERRNIPLLIENSASPKCFGTTLAELLELIEETEAQICLDTAHAYFAGIDLIQFEKDLQNRRVKLIHLNGIQKPLKFGCANDRHGTILETPNWDTMGSTFNKVIKAALLSKIPKVLETPPENWDKELTMANKPDDTLLSAKIKVNGHLVQALIDTGAQ